MISSRCLPPPHESVDVFDGPVGEQTTEFRILGEELGQATVDARIAREDLNVNAMAWAGS